MREVFSFIFDRLTDPLSLPIHPLWEYLILLAIGGIAYAVAYSIVGDMYSSGDIRGGCLGSIFHWIIRFFLFLIIWAVTYAVIALVQWITAHWIIIVSVLGTLALIAGVIAVIIIFRKKGGNP